MQVSAQHSTSGTRGREPLLTRERSVLVRLRPAHSLIFIWVATQSSILSVLTVFPRSFCVSVKKPPLLGRCFAAMLRGSPYIINLRRAFEGGGD